MAKSKGLGDTIDKITTATGIKKAVKKVTGGGCGCSKRKETLNKIFPYKKQSTGKTPASNNKRTGPKIIKK